ncbi:beta-galactosidase trimerization domain-containing protein [Candidatus Bathyarchaeota archaeon]|nr:beta-galactosidase trimerization domain-containing protein [Candidatus Bathyarchaeota archaeon]
MEVEVEVVMQANNEFPKRYQWIKETPIAILEENEVPLWRDASQVADAVESMGAEAIRYPAIRWAVHTYKESKYLPKYPGLGERDLLGEIMNEMKSRGITVIPYCHIGVLHTHAYKVHPEWAARDYYGRPFSWNGVHRMVCLNNQLFIKAMLGAVKEVVSNYNPDAIYFDGPVWYMETCACKYCRKIFEERFGYPLPLKLSWDDGTRQDYNKMRDERVKEVMKLLSESIKELKDIPVFFNTSMKYLPSHNCGIPELTAEHADGANTTEVHRPLSYWEILETARLGEALKKVSLCYCPPGPYESLSTFDTLEAVVFGVTYAAHGGTPMAQTVSAFLYDKTGAAQMKSLLNHLKKNADIYYRAKPVEEVALIYSRQTGENYAKEEVAERLEMHFSGAFRSLIHEHVHFVCLFDTQLTWEKIKDFKVLVLPNVVSLSDSQIDLLKRFVKEGGGLVATYKTSLYDEKGLMRRDFGLKDLFKLTYLGETPKDNYRRRDYRGMGREWGYAEIPEAYLKWSKRHFINENLNLNHLVPVSDACLGMERKPPEYIVSSPKDGAEVIATLYLPSGGAFGESFKHPLGEPPGLVVSYFGKGRVVYVAAPLGKRYLRRGLPELRMIYSRAVKYALGGRSIIEIDAPPGLVINLTKDQSHYYLHLINYTGMMTESPYRVVDWISPLGEIKASLQIDEEVKNIHLLVKGKNVKFNQDDTALRFTIPEINIHETVIIELH